MTSGKAKTLKGKAYHPRECGWMPLDKKHRRWEMPDGKRITFQPHEELIVYVDDSQQAQQD